MARSSVVVFGKRLRPPPATSIEDRPGNWGKRLMAPEVEAGKTPGHGVPGVRMIRNRRPFPVGRTGVPVEGPDLQFTEAVIDNGDLGRHVVRFESGLLARQAAGSATVYLDGDSMLLSATTAQSKPRDAIDFFPLTVDVEERMRGGPHPGQLLPTRGPPVGGRHPHLPIDRPPASPMFRQGPRNEVQVVVTVMALNPNKMYDVVAINAASLSTQLAGLPFSGRSAVCASP